MGRLWLVWPAVLGLACAGCAVAPARGPGEAMQSLRLSLARAERRNLSDLNKAPVCTKQQEEPSWGAEPALTLSALPDFGDEGPSEDSTSEPAFYTEATQSRTDRGPLPGFWDTMRRDLKRLPRSLWDDTKAVYTDPGNLVILGVAGASSLAVRCSGVDGKIDDSHGRHDTFQDEWSDAIGALGNPGTHFAMAGLWYLLGQQTQDDKTYEVGRTLFNALAINGVSTMLLKVAANTESPNGENLAWPSGHTSSSFTVAEVLNVSYGPWVGVPSYALATLAAFGRIDDREHDFSDVLFGAALGIVVGHTVADGHRPEIFGGEITAYVSPNSEAAGIAWVTSF